MKVISSRHPSVYHEAIRTLKRGGLIVYPTETCYGLGVDATNQSAVEKLLAYKGERQGKPVSIAVANRSMAEQYVETNQTADHLYRSFLPGPITVVSKSRRKTAEKLEMHYPNQRTLGIRIPDYPFAIGLIRRYGKPVTATSANTSGRKTPYSLTDLKKYTSRRRLDLIDLFIDAGPLPPNPPSTVVDTTLNEPTILRQGEILIPDIKGQSFVSTTPGETEKVAFEILRTVEENLAVKPIIFALQGELGSGKTQFAKGLGKALGITQLINSPTFVIIHEYPYRWGDIAGVFYHLDTWRLERGEELNDLGLREMFKPGNVIAIEWMQKIRPALESIAAQSKALIVWVTLDYLAETKRRIKYQIK